MVKSRQWIVAKKPENLPVLDGPDATFKLVEVDLPDPKDDEILVKTTFLSNDPAQRAGLRPGITADRYYTKPVEEGEPMNAYGLYEVVETKAPNFKKGDTLRGPALNLGWSEYGVVPAKGCQVVQELPGGLSKTHYLGALGGTGLTAYFGLTEVGKITPDDIVVISGAAGATGSMAVQIAKKIVGCKKVIGIAGTDDKCKWVEEIGADLCLNYKKSSFEKDYISATEEFPNVYFDNVGGEILDLTLSRMAAGGRVIACGAISQYNSGGDSIYGIKNWFQIIIMKLTVQGFIVSLYLNKWGEAIGTLHQALKDGKLSLDKGEHVVKTKFEDIPKTWLMLFDGSNTGKLVTEIV